MDARDDMTSTHSTDSTHSEPERGRRGFWSLSATQFQESFSDNALKWLTISFVGGLGLATRETEFLVSFTGFIFALPFILFSMTGGYLADRYSKRSVIIGTKTVEIPIMMLALAGLWLQSLPVIFVAIFLRSAQSACFSPSKFGLIPELLPEKRLSWGNGVIELGSFMAIILGTVSGGILYDLFRGQLAGAGILLIGATLIGLACATGVARVPAAAPNRTFQFNPVGQLSTEWKAIRQDRVLRLAVLGNAYFFFLANLLQISVFAYGKDVLSLDPTRASYLQGAIAIGIGIGSFAAGYLSGNKIEYGLIPLGAAGITAFSALIWRSGLSPIETGVVLAVLGFSSGFFIVPVAAIIQHRPERAKKGGIIAAANLLSFSAIALSNGVYFLLRSASLSVPEIFLAAAVMTLGATACAVYLMPDSLVRLLLWFLVHTIYRLRVIGRDNIPAKGGALFICNHITWIDAFLLAASTERHVRFLMYQDYYNHPLLHAFAKAMRAIPISSEQRPRDMIRSLRAASEAIRSGEVVCIFAEGQLTRIGQMLPFRRGFERIMKGVDAPVVPVHLGGVWGSIFSFEGGRYLWKLPKRLLQPVTVSYGPHMKGSSTAFEVRQAVLDLQTEAYREQGKSLRTLGRSFVRAAHRHPLRFAMADGTAGLRYASVLTRSVYLARRLRSTWEGQQMVGILLPPSVGGALVNLAALLCGKTPVNLNYTLSSDGVASCAQQCGLQTVITSKAFLERVHVEVPARAVYLEEAAAKPAITERLAALVLSLLPAGMLLGSTGGSRTSQEDLATVIFSSGSTGDPKGVMLTHYNIASNIEQIRQCFPFDGRDCILGILPFFHSFGFMGTLSLPMTTGMAVVFHPNPFDARSIGSLVARHAVTFLLATPTFLQTYTRRCEPGQFGSLRLVLVGAEKLHERTAQAFYDRFGIRPLEAYGCTECSPAVTVNTLDYRAPGVRQVGGKRGKIGHALPGISVRIVDPDSFEPVAFGEPGLLLVKGPNVMKGYLGRPEQTAKVIQEGWYVTGDVATLDEDGFLEITDRLTRFSKIGGEMVPHIKVEEKLHEIAGATEQTFAVTGIPDDKKGERLVVLHTLTDESLQNCLARLDRSGMPNLWMPKAQAFFRIEALPYLGTGKLNLKRVREMASEFGVKRDAAN